MAARFRVGPGQARIDNQERITNDDDPPRPSPTPNPEATLAGPGANPPKTQR